MITLKIGPQLGSYEILSPIGTGGMEEVWKARDTRLGYAYAIAERISKAQAILAELDDLTQKAYVSPLRFAQIYCGLREEDRCLDWFEKAVEGHDSVIYLLGVNPPFDTLRSHPRYRAAQDEPGA